jgi:hypothetical protein
MAKESVLGGTWVGQVCPIFKNAFFLTQKTSD